MNATGCGTHPHPSRQAGAVTPRRPGAVALAAAIIIATLAGCSSASPAIPVATLVSRVNAICTTYTVRIEALAAPSFDPASTTAAELGNAGKYLDQAVPLLQSEQQGIQSAGTPQTDGGMFDNVLTALSAQVRDEQAARTAAHDKDLPAFRSAVAADQRDSTRLAGVAQQFGLDKCI